jgi:hypothetical protein
MFMILFIFSTFIPSKMYLLVLFACVTGMLNNVLNHKEAQELSLFVAAGTTHVAHDVRNVVLRLYRKVGDLEVKQVATSVKVCIVFHLLY